MKKTLTDKISRKFILSNIILLIFFISSCKIYRFTDASVDPNWKTFNIAQTINISTLQNPNAAPAFTELLKEKFLRETRLTLIRDSGDLDFAATITEYSIEPVAITNTETTAQNRLNISVKVECINKVEATKSFTQTFRDGENFDANRQFSDVENGLTNTIYERLVQQIFNRTFGNW
ncbi:MAG TPA: LptE family protein [Chitinophagales bacterium]|nr:LptE family protein [Chitinophagales bacterium]HPA36250.1 LptE family protein [Chitinophagales bacterium]